MTNIFNLPQEVETALERYYSCFDPDTGEVTVTDDELRAAQDGLEELQNRSDEILGWYLEDRENSVARTKMFTSQIERMSAHLARETKRIERSEMLIQRAFERVYE